MYHSRFENSSNPVHVISVTSGKGGVGKSTLTANLAIELEKRDRKVLLLDGDLGMANLDILFQVRANRNLGHVVSGECELKDIIIQVSDQISLIPGGSGVVELQKLSAIAKQSVLDQVSELGVDFDTLLIDTAPGISDNVLYLNSAAQEIAVVLTPDPASFADAYALIKVLHQRHREGRFSIICNQVRNEQDGHSLYQRLESVAAKFLPVRLDYRGSIPLDPALRLAVRSQQLVARTQPQSESALAIAKWADEITQSEAQSRTHDPKECKGSLQFFWRQMLGVPSRQIA